MRLLVHGASLAAGGPRLEPAVLGLALRGHEVVWLGRPPGFAPESIAHVSSPLGLGRANLDVVVGGPAPVQAMLAGWLARAHVMVLGLVRERAAHWGAFDRWAWHGLHATGLVEESEADSWRANTLGLEPERLGLWSSGPAAASPGAEHPDTEILERACERALARHRRRAATGAAFLDRDGTLVREVGYPDHPDDIELLPGAAAAVRRLRTAGWPVVVISNQAGVGRGLYPLARAYETMARLRRLLRESGAELDAIYFCPHRPDEDCACRKPRTALLERAADDLQISLRDSVMFGDKRIDVEAGQRAGGAGMLVRTGYGPEEERAAREAAARGPDGVYDDLESAARAWLARD